MLNGLLFPEDPADTNIMGGARFLVVNDPHHALQTEYLQRSMPYFFRLHKNEEYVLCVSCCVDVCLLQQSDSCNPPSPPPPQSYTTGPATWSTWSATTWHLCKSPFVSQVRHWTKIPFELYCNRSHTYQHRPPPPPPHRPQGQGPPVQPGPAPARHHQRGTRWCGRSHGQATRVHVPHRRPEAGQGRSGADGASGAGRQGVFGQGRRVLHSHGT